jgi:hypothetical protein
MPFQNHLMNVGEVENRVKQNANIYNLLSQIQQRRQTDFDKFLEKIKRNCACFHHKWRWQQKCECSMCSAVVAANTRVL